MGFFGQLACTCEVLLALFNVRWLVLHQLHTRSILRLHLLWIVWILMKLNWITFVSQHAMASSRYPLARGSVVSVNHRREQREWWVYQHTTWEVFPFSCWDHNNWTKLGSFVSFPRGVSYAPTKMALSRGQTAEVNMGLGYNSPRVGVGPIFFFALLKANFDQKTNFSCSQSSFVVTIRLGSCCLCSLHTWGAVRQCPHHGTHHATVCSTWTIHEGIETR